MNPLDVTVIPDGTIRPPAPKMVVCISPEHGWFFRINTSDSWQPCVPLIRVPDHPWLAHDSFLECQILVLDDYIVDEAMGRHGVIGRVSAALADE